MLTPTWPTASLAVGAVLLLALSPVDRRTPTVEVGWWIAFGSFRDGDFSGSLHAIRPDGSSEISVWRREGGRPPVLDPWVSRDGRRAFFGRGGSSHRTAAWTVDLATREERQLTPEVMTRFGSGAVWSSSRPGVASHYVVVEEVDGERRSRLRSLEDTDWAIDLGPGEYPSWSPDGQRLAVTRRDASGTSVWVIEVDGGQMSQVSQVGQMSHVGQMSQVKSEFEAVADAIHPSWSPDGEALLVSRAVGEQYDLFGVDVATRRVTQITDTPSHSERTAVWSPDGALIAYAAGAADGWQRSIFVVDPATGERAQLTTGRFHDMRPSWVRGEAFAR